MSLLTLLIGVFFCTGVPAPVPVPTPAAPPHDYHVSKTNIRYVAEKEQLQVEMHLFVDDLEEALRDAGAPLLDLGTDDEAAESERYLMAYLNKHFKITLNGTDLAPQLIGYELEDDMHGLWIYLATDKVTNPREMTVQNSVLTEYYADQKNIVKLFNGDERVSTLLLDRSRLSGKASFTEG